jgi:hypothetical protein
MRVSKRHLAHTPGVDDVVPGAGLGPRAFG